MHKGILNCDCFARKNEESEIELLNTLDILEYRFPDLKCFDGSRGNNIYTYYIYIPLQFKPIGTLYQIDWEYLIELWERIYEIMKATSNNIISSKTL